MAKVDYAYMVNSDTGTLIRLGDNGDAGFFTLGGWVSSPRLNDIRYGYSPLFMEYDDITEEKAMELIRKEKERAAAWKREHENDSKEEEK